MDKISQNGPGAPLDAELSRLLIGSVSVKSFSDRGANWDFTPSELMRIPAEFELKAWSPHSESKSKSAKPVQSDSASENAAVAAAVSAAAAASVSCLFALGFSRTRCCRKRSFTKAAM